MSGSKTKYADPGHVRDIHSALKAISEYVQESDHWPDEEVSETAAPKLERVTDYSTLELISERIAGQPSPDGGADIDALNRIVNACFNVANAYQPVLKLDAKVPLDDFKASTAGKLAHLHSSAVASITKANEYFSGDGLTMEEKTLETLAPVLRVLK